MSCNATSDLTPPSLMAGDAPGAVVAKQQSPVRVCRRRVKTDP
jgi:hypothetical protein